MTRTAGMVNVLMLMGVGLICFKILWILIFSLVHGVLKVLKKPRLLPLNMFHIIWGYFLTSQAAMVMLQAQQTKAVMSGEYKWIIIVILTLFILSESIGNIWMAERKLDQELQEIVKKQHLITLGIWIYGLLAIWFWPAQGHLAFTQAWVRLIQRLLAMSFWGIIFGVLGIVYEVGLLMRIFKFIRIGPKGLPPFTDALRK